MSNELPDFVVYWAQELGARPQDVRVLTGGMNSRVFGYRSADKSFVIKGYQPLEAGQRDRFMAEKQFLSYANQVAPNYVPKVLHVDDDRRCLVMKYVVGEPYAEGSTLTHADLDSAVRFFSLLNSHHTQAHAQISMDAAEGFLCLSEHLENVRIRLNEMSVSHLPLRLQARARKTIQCLTEAFEPVEALTQQALSAGLIKDELPAHQRCVSPSDFGFHNAIKTTRGVVFFDFEFGGWDDPAKAIVDFTLQPKVPTGQKALALLRALSPATQLKALPRVKALKPILELKWACIIVGFLRPARFEQLLCSPIDLDLESFVSNKLEETLRIVDKEAAIGVH